MIPTCNYPNNSELLIVKELAYRAVATETQKAIAYGANWRERGAYALGYAAGFDTMRSR